MMTIIGAVIVCALLGGLVLAWWARRDRRRREKEAAEELAAYQAYQAELVTRSRVIRERPLDMADVPRFLRRPW
jgi:type II secretory pathway pseudopilin PulG